MSKITVIFHLDLDSFFVSAERLARPELKGKCVAVGGEGGRGVISSASYEARKFGVRSAMPTAQALRLCPRLILLPSNFALYSRLSKQVFDILSRYTPTYEAVSVDEAYLDMSGSESLFGKAKEAAELMRAEILAKTGLTASIGISSNRLVSKVASDFAKPDGVHEVLQGEEARFLAPLAVRVLPGVGKVSEQWLHERRIFKVFELQKYAVETLERHLGKYGLYLHEAAWGRGSTAFHEESRTRSMSREQTFEVNVFEEKILKKELWTMAADLGNSLRSEAETHRDHATTVRLKIRYAPFDTVTRSRVLPAPAKQDLEIYKAIERLFEENWDPYRPVRLIGAGIVLGEGAHQLNLFENSPAKNQEHLKRGAIDELKDRLREKFGPNALRTGRDYE
ncbi:MAG: DNA polymerase IV [Methylotenera sp.]|nr:DNA polymerase IV [Oligoflexia bacterium]